MEIKIADYPQMKSCAHYLRDDAVYTVKKKASERPSKNKQQ